MTAHRFMFLLVFLSAFAASSKESGPFRMTVLRVVSPCTEPSRPFEREPSLISNFWTRSTSTNVTLVGGNFTVLKELKNVNGNVKLFYEEDGVRKLQEMVSFNCKAVLLKSLMRAWGYTPWKDFCNVPKGTYQIKRVNYNESYHMWKKEAKYGLMIIKGEVNMRWSTISCFETFIQVTPDRRRKKKLSG